jgi:A/G-specific adenine glycosylase
VQAFQKKIRQHYRKHGRKLPWREEPDPYRVLVSEIMLQQTQVERVVPKYHAFLLRFPTVEALAAAPLREVLEAWQGLGYNRRAVALQRIAQALVQDFAGILPDSPEILRTLPGIGPATAGALTAFAFNKPSVFIETNIRRVFIHFFFPENESVDDKQILPLVKKTLDRAEPRSWYYALMDYGVMLKTLGENPNRRSAHYHRQSAFQNSDRQIRGRIVKALVSQPRLTIAELIEQVGADPERARAMIDRLASEGLLTVRGDVVTIASDPPNQPHHSRPRR